MTTFLCADFALLCHGDVIMLLYFATKATHGVISIALSFL